MVYLYRSRIHDSQPWCSCFCGWNQSGRYRAGGSNIRVDFGRIIALLRLGAPAATQIMLEISAFAAATALCAKLGPLPLSGHEIALSCAAFTFMVPLGISSAAAVRVGQYLGKRDPQGARRAGWSAITLGCGFMSCSGLIFVLLPTQIARLFSPDPVVIKVGATLLLVAAAFQLFDGLQTVATGALRGTGRHPHADVGQSGCLLVHRTTGRLPAVLSNGMGSSRCVDWLMRGTDTDWIGVVDRVESPAAF